MIVFVPIPGLSITTACLATYLFVHLLQLSSSRPVAVLSEEESLQTRSTRGDLGHALQSTDAGQLLQATEPGGLVPATSRTHSREATTEVDVATVSTTGGRGEHSIVDGVVLLQAADPEVQETRRFWEDVVPSTRAQDTKCFTQRQTRRVQDDFTGEGRTVGDEQTEQAADQVSVIQTGLGK